MKKGWAKIRAKFSPTILILVLVFGWLFLLPAPVYAATTIYANSILGNDTSGNGTAGAPYKTFAKAYAEAASGDTINLSGTFDWSNADETGDVATTGFTISKSLTIEGQGADSTFIQADSTPNTAGKRVFTLNNPTIFQGLTIRYAYLNIAGYTGTAIYAGSSITIINCVIDQNKNHADRYVNGAIYSSGNLIMRGSTVSNNENGYTGGLHLSGSTNEITNSTFYNNYGEYYGAIYLTSSRTLTLTNSTIVGNRGAGLGVWYATLHIKNSLLANRVSGYDFDATGSTIVNNGYNIVETQNSGWFTNGVSGCLVGDQANLNIDSSLADNNSLYGTSTLALQASSVAINAADPADAANNGIAIPTEDQRGAARPDATDIGAYEYGGLIDIDEPTEQASRMEFSNITYQKMDISWSSGNGSRRVIFMKAASSGTASPSDGASYVADTVFGDGTQIDTSSWYCVYNGTGSSVTVTGLSGSTDYRVQIFEYNGTIPGTQNYLTSTATGNPITQATIAVSAPLTQSSDITFSSVSGSQMTVSWTSGDGEKRMVFAKKASTGSATPENSTTYTADATFGDGAQIGTSGWYCVYDGDGDSVTVTGLTKLSNYIFQVFEYNGSSGDEHFLTSTATNNPKYQATTDTASGDDFETGNFSLFSWEFGGNLPWTVTSSDKHDGTYSARAGAITHSQLSYMQVTLDVLEAGDITYWRKVSSESGYDYLRFYIDGVQKEAISGNGSWGQQSFAVAAGTHTFKWQYSKDGSVSNYSDTGFVDDIVFPNINPPTYTLTYGANDHGSISGDTPQYVEEGSDGSEVAAVPNTGYHFTSWSDASTDNPRTDTVVVSDITVTASFAINSYSLQYAAGDHGHITGSTSQTVEYGSFGTLVTAVADSGYHFTKWSDDSLINPRLDVNVTNNISVTATFAKDKTSPAPDPGSGSPDEPDGSGGGSGDTSQEENASLIQTKKAIAKVVNDQSVIGNPQSYRIEILVQEKGVPIVGAEVELHSEVQASITDVQGIATFENVVPGDHRIVVRYDGKEITRKITAGGTAENMNITFEVKENNFIYLALAIILTGLIAFHIYRERKKPPYMFSKIGIR